MYQPKPWEPSEQHAGYNILLGDKKDRKYRQEEKYGSEKGPGSEYNSNKGQKEKDEKKGSFFEEAEEQKKNEEMKEEDIPFRAAKQVFAETMKEQHTKEHKKKSISSIEEAIRKAIEDEKKIIMMD